MLYWLLKWLVGRPLIRLLFEPRLIGEENIPTTGAILIACNHLDAGETILLPALMMRRVVFPAKAELFNGRSLGGRFGGWFLKAIGQVELDRSGGQASADGMGAVGEVLRSGEVLAMFPEGTRSPDGRLYKGHTGVARLALSLGVRVLPLGMIDTQLHHGPFGIPYWRRPTLKFGRPLDFSSYVGAGSNRDALRHVTDEIMNAIMELTGQTYVDMYGLGAKQALVRGENIDHRIQPRPGHDRSGPSPGPVTTRRHDTAA
ncbi:MAG: lysophospholipid acyltransferase family protein [Propionibacteriaceae bacterium]